MKSALCHKLGIEFPLFAFSHCRDVLAAVTNAGDEFRVKIKNDDGSWAKRWYNF